MMAGSMVHDGNIWVTACDVVERDNSTQAVAWMPQDDSSKQVVTCKAWGRSSALVGDEVAICEDCFPEAGMAPGARALVAGSSSILLDSIVVVGTLKGNYNTSFLGIFLYSLFFNGFLVHIINL